MVAAVTEVDTMTTRAPAHAVAAPRDRIATGLFALALGAFLVWGAGFASADALHDTAHDMRHSIGMPCH